MTTGLTIRAYSKALFGKVRATIYSDAATATVYSENGAVVGTLQRKRAYAPGAAWRSYLPNGIAAGEGDSARDAMRGLVRTIDGLASNKEP